MSETSKLEQAVSATKEVLSALKQKVLDDFNKAYPWVAERNIPIKWVAGIPWIALDITVKVEAFESDPGYGGRSGSGHSINIWKAVDVPPIEARVWVLPSAARSHYELDIDSEGSFPHMRKGNAGGCHYIEDLLHPDFSINTYDDFLKMKRVLEYVNRRANVSSLYTCPHHWFRQYKDALPSKLAFIEAIESPSSCINISEKFLKAMKPDGNKEEENTTWTPGIWKTSHNP